MPEKWTGKLIGEMHNAGVTYQELADEMGVTKPNVIGGNNEYIKAKNK